MKPAPPVTRIVSATLASYCREREFVQEIKADDDIRRRWNVGRRIWRSIDLIMGTDVQEGDHIFVAPGVSVESEDDPAIILDPTGLEAG
jgi:hypothetical protein